MTRNRFTLLALWNSRVERYSTKRSTSATRSSRGHLGLSGSNEWNERSGVSRTDGGVRHPAVAITGAPTSGKICEGVVSSYVARHIHNRKGHPDDRRFA